MQINRRLVATGLLGVFLAGMAWAEPKVATELAAPPDEVRAALAAIPEVPALASASDQYEAVFVVDGDTLVGQAVRVRGAGELGVAGWARLRTLLPAAYRRGIVQYNVTGGRRLAGSFSGDGQNDVGRPGYRFSIARYTLEEESGVWDAERPVTPYQGTLDWTIVHEMGHYICLDREGFDRTDSLIELFSQSFDGDGAPPRRGSPQDYPDDGWPVVEGNFVTSYAERAGGDEEVCETFTTYLLIPELPDNDSLVARKIRWFDEQAGMPELRAHIQQGDTAASQ